MTRGRAILIGLLVFGLGAGGWWAFQASGMEGFSAGIAASTLLMVVVIGWTASYLLRVIGGKMTYMEQRRQYRAAYDALTDEELQRRFEALSPAEQEKLLGELGQLDKTNP